MFCLIAVILCPSTSLVISIDSSVSLEGVRAASQWRFETSGYDEYGRLAPVFHGGGFDQDAATSEKAMAIRGRQSLLLAMACGPRVRCRCGRPNCEGRSSSGNARPCDDGEWLLRRQSCHGRRGSSVCHEASGAGACCTSHRHLLPE